MKEKLELVFAALIDQLLGKKANLDINSMLISLAIIYVGLSIFKLGEKISDGFTYLTNNLYRIR